MNVDWGVFWGFAGTVFAAAALGVVAWQEVRRWRERPFASWGISFERLDDPCAVGMTPWKINLVPHADFEIRQLRLMGNAYCRIPEHELEGAQIPYIPVGEDISVKILVEDTNQDKAWFILMYYIPPLRRQQMQATWMPAIPQSPLKERITEWDELPLWKRWSFRLRTTIPGPGGPHEITYTSRRTRRIIRTHTAQEEAIDHHADGP